jgi:opacity protein-like surface antigen
VIKKIAGGLYMKKITFVGLLSVLLFPLVQPVSAASTITGNLNLLLGQKLLSESDWKNGSSGGVDLSEQGEVGILFDFRALNWPVNIAVDYLASEAEESSGGIDFGGKTTEFALGVRKYFMEETKVSPFIGGGLANVSAEFSVNDVSVKENDLGLWLTGGLNFRPVNRLNLGLAIRYTKATVEFSREDVEAGGVHAGAYIGWNF